MATFSVDITDITFAGGRTGSKVVTISNAPADGIGISNTGYGTHFKVIVQEQNVSYQIKTKSTNTSGSSYSSRIRFYNNGDSTDYVDIPIVQYSVTEMALYADNLTYNTSIVYNLDIDYQSGSTDLYIDAEGGYYGSVKVTIGGKWLSVVQASPLATDTGFSHYIISYTENNVISVRTGGIVCSDTKWTRSITVTQDGGGLPALTVSPSSETISSAAGTVVVTVTGASDISYSISGSWITFDHKNGDDYYFNYEANPVNTYVRYGSITFSATGYLSGVCQLKQNLPMVFLPTSKSVDSSSGSVTIQFYSPNPPSSYNISYDISDSWITFDSISGSGILFNYTANSGSSSRTGVVTFLVNNFDTKSFTLTQAGGAPSSVSVTPSSLSFGPDASYADISLTYGGTYFNTDAQEVYTWVTVNMSDKGGGQATGTVSVPVNNTTASRKGNIYFTDEEGGSIALPVEQSGIQAVLSANPSSLNIPAEGGTVTTAVTYVGSLSAASLPSWLSETHTDTDSSHRTYSLTAASNGPTQERTFNWRLDDDYNNMYVFISQAAKIQSSLVISPTSQSVGSPAGTVEITVRSTNISEISYDITGDWIKYKSKSGSVYTFSYEQNPTTSTREGTITFSGGGISRTFTLSQESGQAASYSVSPSYVVFPNTGGKQLMTITNRPTYNHIKCDKTNADWVYSSGTSISDYLYADINMGSSSKEGVVRYYMASPSEVDLGESVYIPVSQGGGLNIFVSQSTLLFDVTGGTQIVTIKYNNSFNIDTSSAPDWLSFRTDVVSQGVVHLFVTATSNTSTDGKSYTLGITGGGQSTSLVIKQMPQDLPGSGFSLSDDQVFLKDYSGSDGQVVTYGSPYYSSRITYKKSDSWISVAKRSSGNNVLLTVTATNNTGVGIREGYVTVIRDNTDKLSFKVIQYGCLSDVSLFEYPESLVFDVTGGSKDIYEKNISTYGYHTYPDWITESYSSGAVYTYTASLNDTGYPRSGYIDFYNPNYGYHHYVPVYQEAGGMTVSPSSKSFSSAGGSQVFRVTYNTRINYNTLPSWLSIVSGTSSGSTIEYTMTAAENTGTSRSFNWVLTDAVNSVTVRILQSGTGPGPGGNVEVSPDSLVFGPDGGSSSVTVTYTGTLSINTDMFPGWLSMVSSGDTYTFSVSENIGGTESRSFGVIFRSGGDTAVLNILQGGRYASFSVTPEKIEFGPDASSRTVYFGFVPSAGLGYQVKSGTGGWLSVSMNTPVATVSVTNNYGTAGLHLRRSSSIKFYNLNDPDDYVVVLIEQEGAGAVYSMWNDYSFTPDDVTAGDDFHFLISINGGQINDDFYGVSPYIEGTGRDMRHSGIVPLNISRYLNKCIEGNRYILFDDSYYKPYVWNQLWGEVYVDIKHLDENGDIIKLYPQIRFWNDWSYKVKCYDYNRTLNDPINKKGCSGMYVPFCVYTDILDESTSYSVTKTDEIGEQVTNVLGNPHPFAGVDFAISCDRYYNAQKVEFKRGSEVVLSYDMTHCGDGYLLYRNRFGGWDSFLIEGNIKKKDSFTRSYMSRNGSYDACLYNVETVDTNVKTSYELSTSWLSDDESERLVYHLLSSPTIYFHSFKDDSTIKVNIVDSSSEYKKFKNGRNLVSYVITVEDTLTRQVNK